MIKSSINALFHLTIHQTYQFIIAKTHNLFLNDFFYFFDKASLHNFADDNTLSAKSKTLEELKSILTLECEVAIDWLNSNQMLANPGKFQVMFLTSSKGHILTPLPINQNLIESKQSVELLGIEIDDKLKFESHISKICGSAAGQINSLYRFDKYLIPQARNLAANILYYQILPTVLWYGTFVLIVPIRKLNQLIGEQSNFLWVITILLSFVLMK